MLLGVEEGLSKVSVSDVRVAVATNPGVEAGMVTLREEEHPYRSVPIVIGQPEARAIQAAWTKAAAKRPSTWDLFVAALDAVEGRLDRVVIDAVEEGRHFFAHLELESAAGRRSVPARPSDAIALALRAEGAGIYINEQVFRDLGLGVPLDN
jgi:bifunctional DNase/RNase